MGVKARADCLGLEGSRSEIKSTAVSQRTKRRQGSSCVSSEPLCKPPSPRSQVLHPSPSGCPPSVNGSALRTEFFEHPASETTTESTVRHHIQVLTVARRASKANVKSTLKEQAGDGCSIEVQPPKLSHRWRLICGSSRQRKFPKTVGRARGSEI